MVDQILEYRAARLAVEAFNDEHRREWLGTQEGLMKLLAELKRAQEDSCNGPTD